MEQLKKNLIYSLLGDILGLGRLKSYKILNKKSKDLQYNFIIDSMLLCNKIVFEYIYYSLYENILKSKRQTYIASGSFIL